MQLARRIYGSRIAPRAEHLNEAVEAAKGEKCQQALEKLMKSDIKQLREIYQSREIEPEMAGEDWTPAKRDYL
jgi:sensor domain CHASE-containing protein